MCSRTVQNLYNTRKSKILSRNKMGCNTSDKHVIKIIGRVRNLGKKKALSEDKAQFFLLC